MEKQAMNLGLSLTEQLSSLPGILAPHSAVGYRVNYEIAKILNKKHHPMIYMKKHNLTNKCKTVGCDCACRTCY